MNTKTKDRLLALGFLLLCWMLVAEGVFAIRHPWATDTERFIHTFDALTFRFVPYRQMRPRDE